MSDGVTVAFWVMVFLQTIGSVDMPGRGERKLPSPRSYVSIIVLFSLLQIIASAGAQRAASVMAWITVLLGLVKGPFGKTAIDFLNNIAQNFGINQR